MQELVTCAMPSQAQLEAPLTARTKPGKIDKTVPDAEWRAWLASLSPHAGIPPNRLQHICWEECQRGCGPGFRLAGSPPSILTDMLCPLLVTRMAQV